MTFSRRALLGLLAAVALTLAPASAHALVIDNFSTTQSVVATGAVPTAFNFVNFAGVLGTERDMKLTITSAPDPGDTSRGRSNAGMAGVLTFSQDRDVVSTLEIQYDGDDDDAVNVDPTGLGGVDLTADGSDRFLLENVSADVAATISITVYTDASNFATWNVSVPAGTLLTDFFVLFTTAPDSMTGTVDLTNVGAIVLTITGTTGGNLDFEMESFQTTVPEPNTVTFLGIAFIVGAVGLGYRRRKNDL